MDTKRDLKHDTTNNLMPKSMIIIAGMHRSGTSAITRVVNLCGAQLPESLLIPIDGENERGFWESQKIMELHDEIFESVGCQWSSLTTVPLQWFSSTEAQPYKNRLIRLLTEEYQQFDIGLVKDPRICKLVPLWEDVLASMNIQPHYIICVRNPLEIVKSLQARNGFEFRYALSLWFVHLQLLEKATRSQSRVFVRYSDILTDYSKVIKRINDFLKTDLMYKTPDIQQQVDLFLSNSLRHHQYDSDDLKENHEVPQVVHYFNDWLKNQSDQNNDITVEEDALNLEPQLAKDINANFVQYLQNIELQEKQLNTKYRLTEELIHKLEDADSQIELYKEQEGLLLKTNSSLKKKITEFNLLINDQTKKINLLENQHKKGLTDLKTTKAALKSEKTLQTEIKRKNKSLLRLIAKGKQDLHTVELRLHEFKRTGAWKVGARIFELVRIFRSSIIGKSLLFFKALITFKLRTYFTEQKHIQIIRKSGLFDADFYLNTYPLIAYSFKSPIEHYVSKGEGEGRQPNRAFKPYFYTSELEGKINKYRSALVHYILEGAELDYDPNPNFSSKSYRKKYTTGKQSPLAHYLDGTKKNFDHKASAVSQPFDPEGIAERINDWQILSDPDAVDRNVKLNFLMNEFESLVCKKPIASIVIPVFNQLDLTVHCLWSLARFQNQIPFEVIVVNDHSTDETQQVLELIPGLILLKTPENSGFVISSNLGAKAASGDYTVLLNNDTAVLDGWLDQLVEVFLKHPDIGYVCSKLLYADKTLQEAGCVVWNDGSAWNIGRNGDPVRPEFNYLRDTHYGSGCSVMTPSSLFKKLGYFDLKFKPGYYEDIDYAYKVRANNKRVVYQPFSQLIHFEGKTGGTDTSSGAKKYQVVNKETFKELWSSTLLNEKPESTPLYKVDNYQASGHVLFIEPTHLTPDQDAGSAMSFNLIRALLKMRMKVTFIASESFTYHHHYTKLLQAEGVECLYRPYYKSLQDVFSARPDAWDYIFIARLHCITEVFDEVSAANPSAKVIFQTIDLSSLRERREQKLGVNPVSEKQIAFKEKQELRYIKSCDKSIIVSNFERELLVAKGLGNKVSTMPLLTYEYPEPVIDNRQGVMFIGGFRHQPNIDAVRFLAQEIAPLVLEKDPDLIFYIVGGGVPDELMSFSSQNIIFMGQIQNPDSFFQSMRLSVAPLRYGAGIKGKVIQSMAAGLPCVGTPIALEGIGTTEETGVIVSEKANEIAEGILKLSSDDKAWTEAANRGHQFSRGRYSPNALLKDVENFMGSIL